jgi:hypothetical protein
MKNYAYGIHENEKIRLTEFINVTQAFLASLIIEGKEKHIFGGHFRDHLIKAWYDMPSHFEEIRVKLAIKDELALSFNGLTGGQLALKLAMIDQFMLGYHDALTKNEFNQMTKLRLRQLLSMQEILVFDLIQATNSGDAASSLLKCMILLLDQYR